MVYSTFMRYSPMCNVCNDTNNICVNKDVLSRSQKWSAEAHRNRLGLVKGPLVRFGYMQSDSRKFSLWIQWHLSMVTKERPLSGLRLQTGTQPGQPSLLSLKKALHLEKLAGHLHQQCFTKLCQAKYPQPVTGLGNAAYALSKTILPPPVRAEWKPL